MPRLRTVAVRICVVTEMALDDLLATINSDGALYRQVACNGGGYRYLKAVAAEVVKEKPKRRGGGEPTKEKP